MARRSRWGRPLQLLGQVCCRPQLLYGTDAHAVAELTSNCSHCGKTRSHVNFPISSHRAAHVGVLESSSRYRQGLSTISSATLQFFSTFPTATSNFFPPSFDSTEFLD
ncbi:hypothetical protein Mapa_001430 [Marchantia paleacea]|nr:hypothetical protein Mapa_001430 [Marchantia paleacea]